MAGRPSPTARTRRKRCVRTRASCVAWSCARPSLRAPLPRAPQHTCACCCTSHTVLQYATELKLGPRHAHPHQPSAPLAPEPPGAAAAQLHRQVMELTPPQWLPDSMASVCGGCHKPFRALTRLRHHCRCCGRIFCNGCSSQRALLPPKFNTRCGPRWGGGSTPRNAGCCCAKQVMGACVSGLPVGRVHRACRLPERTCDTCAAMLAPVQPYLAGTHVSEGAGRPPACPPWHAPHARPPAGWLGPHTPPLLTAGLLLRPAGVAQATAAQPPVHDAVLDSVSLRAWLNAPYCASLEQDVFKAANVLAKFTQVRALEGGSAVPRVQHGMDAFHRAVACMHSPGCVQLWDSMVEGVCVCVCVCARAQVSRLHPESGVPAAVLAGACGLVVMSLVKVGAGWSATFGTGTERAQRGGGTGVRLWKGGCAEGPACGERCTLAVVVAAAVVVAQGWWWRATLRDSGLRPAPWRWPGWAGACRCVWGARVRARARPERSFPGGAPSPGWLAPGGVPPPPSSPGCWLRGGVHMCAALLLLRCRWGVS